MEVEAFGQRLHALMILHGHAAQTFFFEAYDGAAQHERDLRVEHGCWHRAHEGQVRHEFGEDHAPAQLRYALVLAVDLFLAEVRHDGCRHALIGLHLRDLDEAFI